MLTCDSGQSDTTLPQQLDLLQEQVILIIAGSRDKSWHLYAGVFSGAFSGAGVGFSPGLAGTGFSTGSTVTFLIGSPT
jgi:hypothetical protein